MSKVYGSIHSTCTQRVLIVLEELGMPYELVDIDMRAGQHQDPKYVTERHPFAKVPAFEDDSGRLFESRAICRYLAQGNLGAINLLGNESNLAQLEQATSVEYSYFDPPFQRLAYEKIFKRMMGHGEPDVELIRSYTQQLQMCLDYYEGLLATQTYLAGNSYTIVDIFHMPWMEFFEKLDLSQEAEKRPHLLAWWQLVRERQGWKAVISQTTSH